ncbi:hypothetical protein G3O08_18040 [Cryomorpha ignava]|uniref:Uncharacterized protein n=1 Tax=Cryomorpha ignava TaxID=101383 RepID=A0A7K3WWI2_9FLAO|nr:hypothetical protein [Cryomorpha ignava]NEN25401.1 hypothetical protein [Cryomorpha ignava]
MKHPLESKIYNQPIAKLRQREAILNFMDPAAWYMTFFKAGVNIPDEAEPVKGFDAIYTTLLSTFITRNTLYLDIRNENSYSLNYYKDNEGLTGDSDYGDHIQVSWDGITFAPANFYKDYWPILTLSPPANTNTNYNELHLKFRKLYNPEPLLYADYAVELISDTLMNISSSTKFKSETNPVLAEPWSSGFTFKLPNNPAVSGNTAPAFPIKLMNIRQKNPDIALPSTVVQKEHFLDNAFGPANYVPDVAAGSSTQWVSGLGKRFIDGRNEMGVAGVFEIGMGISSTEVSFFASIIDEYRPGITFGRSQVKKSTPETGGKSQSPSLIAELNKTWFKDRNFELQKQELSGSTFYIMDQKTLDPPTNISGLINVVMSKSEYDAITIPSNLDTTIHAPLLSFQSFSMESDNNQVPYRKAALKVNGATSSGTKTTSGLGVDLLTFNYGMLNSETAGNVVELEEAVNGIITVNGFIEMLKVVEDVYGEKEGIIDFGDNLIEICTRIRVHYYGGERDLPEVYYLKDVVNGKIFNNTIPLAEYMVDPIFYRKLDRLPFATRALFSGVNVYDQLTSHGNENAVKDNPSPYLVNDLGYVDLGQVLYGFESIFYQPHYPPTSIFPTPPSDMDKPPSDTYSPSYENFPVKIINDLAGWIANIAIPATDYFLHVRDGVSPIKERYAPTTPNLQAYYDISAPIVDLNGNADSIGILWAYEVLNENPNNEGLKLSDVFTLYYQGETNLRSEITLPSTPSLPFYAAVNRWKIFSLFFGFMAEDGGEYIWVPDNPTLWAKVKAPFSQSNPQGKNYDERLFNLAEFWYSSVDNNYPIPIISIPKIAYNLQLGKEIPETLIKRFTSESFYNPETTQILWINSQLKILLEDKFLNYVYSQIF